MVASRIGNAGRVARVGRTAHGVLSMGVESVSVVSANGFDGTVANATTTPAITLTCGVTGLLKGNGTAISAAVADVDYATPESVIAYAQPLDASLTAVAALTTTSFGLSLLESADEAEARALIDLATIAASVFAESPVDGSLTLSAKAAFAFTIDQIRGLKTASGTCTVAVKINGTDVTGLSALSVTSTPQDATATAANAVSVGDRITLVISSSSSPIGLEFTLSGTR